MKPVHRGVVAVDLFCGVGGLTIGLSGAGIQVVAGIDSDSSCAFAYTENSGAKFIHRDVRELHGADLASFFPKDSIRLLAGCAPCKPFSALRRRGQASEQEDWSLLRHFARIAKELVPDLITMENVPRVASRTVFKEFVEDLQRMGYQTDWKSVYCPRYGIPQRRRRLVLLASKLGNISMPDGPLLAAEHPTLRETIGRLPRVHAGQTDKKDSLHRARTVSDLNLKRLRASTPGGTWRDWPEQLRAPCHRKKSGLSFKSVYSRMSWDEPAPTMTTQFFNFGTGRFGHPEQDRAITPREAALIQTFPRDFVFFAPDKKMTFAAAGRMIGNAVPPLLAYHVGKELLRVANAAAHKSTC